MAHTSDRPNYLVAYSEMETTSLCRACAASLEPDETLDFGPCADCGDPVFGDFELREPTELDQRFLMAGTCCPRCGRVLSNSSRAN